MIFEPSTSNRDSEVCKRVVPSVFTIIYIYLCYDASKKKTRKSEFIINFFIFKTFKYNLLPKSNNVLAGISTPGANLISTLQGATRITRRGLFLSKKFYSY